MYAIRLSDGIYLDFLLLLLLSIPPRLPIQKGWKIWVAKQWVLFINTTNLLRGQLYVHKVRLRKDGWESVYVITTITSTKRISFNFLPCSTFWTSLSNPPDFTLIQCRGMVGTCNKICQDWKQSNKHQTLSWSIFYVPSLRVKMKRFLGLGEGGTAYYYYEGKAKAISLEGKMIIIGKLCCSKECRSRWRYYWWWYLARDEKIVAMFKFKCLNMSQSVSRMLYIDDFLLVCQDNI